MIPAIPPDITTGLLVNLVFFVLLSIPVGDGRTVGDKLKSSVKNVSLKYVFSWLTAGIFFREFIREISALDFYYPLLLLGASIAVVPIRDRRLHSEATLFEAVFWLLLGGYGIWGLATLQEIPDLIFLDLLLYAQFASCLLLAISKIWAIPALASTAMISTGLSLLGVPLYGAWLQIPLSEIWTDRATRIYVLLGALCFVSAFKRMTGEPRPVVGPKVVQT